MKKTEVRRQESEANSLLVRQLACMLALKNKHANPLIHLINGNYLEALVVTTGRLPMIVGGNTRTAEQISVEHFNMLTQWFIAGW